MRASVGSCEVWEHPSDNGGRGQNFSQGRIYWHPNTGAYGIWGNLRGIALGFRNLNHYILRSLIHSGGLAERLHAL